MTIKISPLFVGIGIIFVIGLGLLLYMKKEISNSSKLLLKNIIK